MTSHGWSPRLLCTRTSWSFDSNRITRTKHPIARMIGRSQFPGRNHPPKDPARSCFRTMHLEATSVRNSSSAGPRLVSAIARGRRWLDDVVSGRITTIAELCTREKCSVRQVNMTISLAFLAPNLVKAAIEGRLPRGIGVERLRDPPTEWSRQFEALGLNPE